jgi:hypothetical protein
MLALLIVMIAAAASEQELYFPTRAGATWTYNTPDREFVRTVMKVESVDGARIVSVSQVRDDGTAVPHEVVSVSERGLVQLVQPIVRLNAEGGSTDDVVPRNPPLDLLKLPLKPGDSWKYSTDDRKLSFKVGRPERVKTPAGEFQAIPVELGVKLAGGGPTIQGKYWYARGVGVVKWTSRLGGTEQVVVLKSFNAGKD